ncbi:MAG: helix-turn-helix transcriptional regulator [Herpetosiphonaceae bacterium]|nr:helix-turn-helix transcriptional regulator [Herpetosiphonaceae bacterium]
MASNQISELLEASEGSSPTSGGRIPNPAYELFVLGELMNGPQYGYRLHAIIQRILGPFHRLSWGTLYPLIRRLEQHGLITSTTERRPAALLEERGQPRKQYVLTESGRTRFLTLMLDPGTYSPDYPDLFAVKLTKFGLLTPPQRLVVLHQYRAYLQLLRDHYDQGRSRIVNNPGISDPERPSILQLVDYHIHTLGAQLAWLDRHIAELTEAPQ